MLTECHVVYGIIAISVPLTLTVFYLLINFAPPSARWYAYPAILPDPLDRITVYPVAFFDEEFGIVVDIAEFHRNSDKPWRSMDSGRPCTPFAWYDLPRPPHP